MSQVIEETQEFVFFFFFCYTFNRGNDMKRILKLLFILILILVLIDLYVILASRNKIVSINDLSDKDFDCILVLGAGIRKNKPSPMLEDRLSTAIYLYNKGIASKIFLSVAIMNIVIMMK